jgi:hypothetical protein
MAPPFVVAALPGLGATSSEPTAILRCMLLEPGYAEGTRVVHLTHTTLIVEALCGEPAGLHGEPDLAVLCDECLEHARALGIDIAVWVTEVQIDVQLPLAA